MMEYLEDLIEIDPAEEFPQDVQVSGRYAHKTGDALLDEWQAKAATGEHIDFGEAFEDAESKKAFEAVKAASRARHQAKQPTQEPPDEHQELPEEFHDDYTGGR